MPENRQKAEILRRRQHSVPLEGYRVIISIAVRQRLNALSDGSSTPARYQVATAQTAVELWPQRLFRHRERLL